MLALPQQGSNQYGTVQSQWFISRGFELGFVAKKHQPCFKLHEDASVFPFHVYL